jgi:deoxyribodipyrimidine photolyase
MHLFWHQRDLRIPDNRGLARAAADDVTLPVYVVDPDLLKQIGARQRAFLLDGVRDLRERYRELGSDLVVRSGAPDDVLADLADATGADDFVAFDTDAAGTVPEVDAGMRQLDEEGYVHNRPRQNAASFLTKHLLIDWRTGARYFTRKLIDHDPASNHGNWQWIASTGTDSVDVRVFDPVAQLSKYDDGAHYVKTYVPELRDGRLRRSWSGRPAPTPNASGSRRIHTR